MTSNRRPARDMENCAKISVRGVVQGVGFRPFVYRLAQQHNLKGYVRNTSGNVEIEVEGDKEILNRFMDSLQADAPPLAQIEAIETAICATKGYSDFEIRESLAQDGGWQLVSPDIATCEDCKQEIFSQANRRFGYPFTNCTNCGPRFTIIEDIPYDRARTTMRTFPMCPECRREYDDPLDRRFHAQPNACPTCGPQLRLTDRDGVDIPCDDAIEAAAALLKEGYVLATKGLGGFHLVCDATDEAAVAQLRARKRRPSKPFAVMVRDLEEADRHCVLTPVERSLLASPECPIVLAPWRKEASSICPAVAPALRYLGIMLPYTPFHHLLLAEANRPLVMTSANLSGEPLTKDNGESLEKLGTIVDYFVLHNRDIHVRCDDSVCMVEAESLQVIRRARGYAPHPIHLPFEAKQVLACGAELKNTICLTHGRHAFLSQHIGDMQNEETLHHFKETIALYKRLFRLKPQIVAYDMHPEYVATKYAHTLGKRDGLNLVAVQHHHAHIAGCLVDNKTEGPAIGVALDGTGYGTDGTIWGGEFLVADLRGFERAGHLETVPMPGGEAAIKRPYRMALGYLYSLLGEGFPLDGLPVDRTDPIEREVIKQQLARGINSPLTSSAGRLFDAVAALTGVRQATNYDAQAAIELEMVVTDDATEADVYPYSIDRSEKKRVVRLGRLLEAIVHDVTIGTPAATVSARFHRTVAEAVTSMCKQIAEERGIDRVALTGGVFQNRLLLRLVTAALRRGSFTVLTHHRVPCNDAGISLGQAVIANFR